MKKAYLVIAIIIAVVSVLFKQPIQAASVMQEKRPLYVRISFMNQQRYIPDVSDIMHVLTTDTVGDIRTRKAKHLGVLKTIVRAIDAHGVALPDQLQLGDIVGITPEYPLILIINVGVGPVD